MRVGANFLVISSFVHDAEVCIADRLPGIVKPCCDKHLLLARNVGRNSTLIGEPILVAVALLLLENSVDLEGELGLFCLLLPDLLRLSSLDFLLDYILALRGSTPLASGTSRLLAARPLGRDLGLALALFLKSGNELPTDGRTILATGLVAGLVAVTAGCLPARRLLLLVTVGTETVLRHGIGRIGSVGRWGWVMLPNRTWPGFVSIFSEVRTRKSVYRLGEIELERIF